MIPRLEESESSFYSSCKDKMSERNSTKHHNACFGLAEGDGSSSILPAGLPFNLSVFKLLWSQHLETARTFSSCYCSLSSQRAKLLPQPPKATSKLPGHWSIRVRNQENSESFSVAGWWEWALRPIQGSTLCCAHSVVYWLGDSSTRQLTISRRLFNISIS